MTRILLLLFVISMPVSAGPYLDLAVGAHVGEWESTPHGAKYLGEAWPLGSLRVGYEYKILQVYYEHVSSMPEPDTGINLIMMGIHLDFEELDRNK